MSIDRTIDSAPDTAANPAGLTVFLETFGCQMNVLDSQLVVGQLRGLGYTFIDDWKQADIVLYNTCSVRERAEQKVWSRVGEVGVHKKNHPNVLLGVIGCMAERDGEDTVRKYPQVDLLCGPGELDKLPMLIDNAVKTTMDERGGLRAAKIALQGDTHRRTATLAAAEDKLEMLDLSRSFSPDDHTGSAYVRITRGCNKFCTYCVVPRTRGAEVHRPPSHIVDECKMLVASGVNEITLLGQTVNHYHYDNREAVELHGHLQPQVGSIIGPNRGTGGPSPVFGDGVTSFAKLLKRICDEVPDLLRLRFVTSFPRDFGDDILQVMADEPRICRYLHLPVQSGSDRMLKMMNRGYTVEEFLSLVDRVRSFMPDAELATDIICGFPTETEEDHLATADLLRRGGFKNSFIFKYSPRPGTAAYDRLEDDVSETDKKRRNNELLAVQSEVSSQVHKAYVGKTVKVFVESVSARHKKTEGRAGPGMVELGWEKPQPVEEVTQLTGRTSGDIIVVFDGDPSLIGSMADIKIINAAPLTLFGEVVGVPASV